MSNAPILADFAVRLSFGLAIISTVAGRDVTAKFFQTNCQVVLGLLALSVLDVSRAEGAFSTWGPWALSAAAIAAYAGSIAWGLGLARFGRRALGLIALIGAVWLASVSRAPDEGLWLFNGASRWTSGLTLGAGLGSMLLGHHYLTAPAMPIEPLKRWIWLVGMGLCVRAGLALAGPLIWPETTSEAVFDSQLLPAMRWGMGLVAPGVAVALAWATARIRSTQSATGILYAALALILAGELSSMIAERPGAPIP